MMRRARLSLAAPLIALLSACGLQPVYSGGATGAAGSSLSAIDVGPIEGQAGWLVRNKLVERLGSGEKRDAHYRLDVTLDDSLTSFGIRGDRSATRERRTLRARYQLVSIGTGLVVLDATAGSDAGIDVVSSDYATVAGEQTALENLTGIIADQIVARLATFGGRDGASR